MINWFEQIAIIQLCRSSLVLNIRIRLFWGSWVAHLFLCPANSREWDFFSSPQTSNVLVSNFSLDEFHFDSHAVISQISKWNCNCVCSSKLKRKADYLIRGFLHIFIIRRFSEAWAREGKWKFPFLQPTGFSFHSIDEHRRKFLRKHEKNENVSLKRGRILMCQNVL